MASNRHRQAVNGRTTPVGPERVRGWSEPDTVSELVDRADNYVDSVGADTWIDCFQLNGDTYEVNVCDCFLPTIVCRSMEEEEAHSRAPSKSTNSMIESLKASMGADNYNIINELRKREDRAATAQAAAAARGAQLSAPTAPPTARRWVALQAARQLGSALHLGAHRAGRTPPQGPTTTKMATTTTTDH